MQVDVQKLNKQVSQLRFILIAVLVSTWVVGGILVFSSGSSVTNQGGAGGNADVQNTIVYPDTKQQILKKAQEQGYFTLKQYADYHGIHGETVSRRIKRGDIAGAVMVDGRWRIPLPTNER